MRDIYSHVYDLIWKCYISPKSLGAHFGNVLQLQYFVHFANRFEITVPNSINEEPLLGEIRVRCIIELSFIRIVCTFYTHTYPALFVSLKYIHLHHFDIPKDIRILMMLDLHTRCLCP